MYKFVAKTEHRIRKFFCKGSETIQEGIVEVDIGSKQINNEKKLIKKPREFLTHPNYLENFFVRIIILKIKSFFLPGTELIVNRVEECICKCRKWQANRGVIFFKLIYSPRTTHSR